MIIIKLEDYRVTPRADEKFYVADSEGPGEHARLLAGKLGVFIHRSKRGF